MTAGAGVKRLTCTKHRTSGMCFSREPTKNSLQFNRWQRFVYELNPQKHRRWWKQRKHDYNEHQITEHRKKAAINGTLHNETNFNFMEGLIQ